MNLALILFVWSLIGTMSAAAGLFDRAWNWSGILLGGPPVWCWFVILGVGAALEQLFS